MQNTEHILDYKIRCDAGNGDLFATFPYRLWIIGLIAISTDDPNRQNRPIDAKGYKINTDMIVDQVDQQVCLYAAIVNYNFHHRNL